MIPREGEILPVNYQRLENNQVRLRDTLQRMSSHLQRQRQTLLSLVSLTDSTHTALYHAPPCMPCPGTHLARQRPCSCCAPWQ